MTHKTGLNLSDLFLLSHNGSMVLAQAEELYFLFLLLYVCSTREENTYKKMFYTLFYVRKLYKKGGQGIASSIRSIPSFKGIVPHTRESCSCCYFLYNIPSDNTPTSVPAVG